MTDIKELSPAIVQYQIHLNKEEKSKRDLQRRLNPIMQEAVRAEIVKLLDNGIIYPIFEVNRSAQSTRFWKCPVSPW